MKKLILAFAILATTGTAVSAEDAANDVTKTPTALCSITMYADDPVLLTGAKFKLRSGEFLISDCTANARLFEMDWWQLSTKFAKAWNAISNLEEMPPAENATPANKEIGHGK